MGGALLHLSVSGDMDVSAADLQQLSVEHLLWLISTAVLILRQKLGFSDNWEFVNPDPVGYQQRPGQGANMTWKRHLLYHLLRTFVSLSFVAFAVPTVLKGAQGILKGTDTIGAIDIEDTDGVGCLG